MSKTIDFQSIGLGDRVRDPITGFSGIVTCVTIWLHGCIRIGIQPEVLHEGKPLEDKYFDQSQLELIETKVYRPMILDVVAAPETETRRSIGGPSRESVSSKRS